MLLSLRNPQVFTTFAAYSGYAYPTYLDDDAAQTIATLYGGSRADYEAHDPAHLLATGRYPAMGGWFAAGADDPQPLADASQLARLAGGTGMQVCLTRPRAATTSRSGRRRSGRRCPGCRGASASRPPPGHVPRHLPSSGPLSGSTQRARRPVLCCPCAPSSTVEHQILNLKVPGFESGGAHCDPGRSRRRAEPGPPRPVGRTGLPVGGHLRHPDRHRPRGALRVGLHRRRRPAGRAAPRRRTSPAGTPPGGRWPPATTAAARRRARPPWRCWPAGPR